MGPGIGLSVLVVGALLCGCSTATSTSTTATSSGSLNVTPCNFAGAWHDNPTQFSEFAALARYARMAKDADLRAEGRRLSAVVTSDNTGAIGEVAGTIFATCRRLGLAT